MFKQTAVVIALATILDAPAIAVPTKTLTDKQIQIISAYTAMAFCLAKNGVAAHPGLTLDQSLQKIWSSAGVPLNNSYIIPEYQTKAIEANIKVAYDALNPNCTLTGELTYQRPVKPGPQGLDGFTVPPRVQQNIAECRRHLANKYGIYTRGQLSTCVSSLGHYDLMNNIPLW